MGCYPQSARRRPELFQRRVGAFPFVLSVGRIEPRKNTLALVRPARRLALPLVIVGEAPPGFEQYEAECRSAADPRTIWLGRLDHHDPLLGVGVRGRPGLRAAKLV